MPIFYSQFLRDDNKASLAACEVSRQNVKENTPSNNGQNLRSSFKGSQRSQQEQQQRQPPTPPSSPMRLVWHNHKGKSPNLKTRIISPPFPFNIKTSPRRRRYTLPLLRSKHITVTIVVMKMSSSQRSRLWQ